LLNAFEHREDVVGVERHVELVVNFEAFKGFRSAGVLDSLGGLRLGTLEGVARLLVILWDFRLCSQVDNRFHPRVFSESLFGETFIPRKGVASVKVEAHLRMVHHGCCDRFC